MTLNMDAPQGVAGAPNERALLDLMARTGYSMIQENGQRKYGGPPPVWEGPPPPRGCEVFIGKIPRDTFEDELVPAFEKIGNVYEFRLMMDFSGSNRGYGFCTYINRQDAQRAVKEMNNFEIRKGRLLGVCHSVDNCRLFVGGIPKNKTKEEIMTEMKKVTDGVKDVIVYPSALDKSKNRGFAFVEYDSHRTAAMGRRKLIPGRILLWGHQIAVDWAEPEQDVDEDIMSKVKILYVRNLMLATTEATILDAFTKAAGKENCIERVKKLKDYAFVHFKEREDCLKAMQAMNGANLEDSKIEVVLAKPVDKAEHLRYTRGKNVLPQDEDQEIEGLNEAFGYGMNFNDSMGQSSGMYNPVFNPFVPGQEFTRTAAGVRGFARGRGRGAAGSRGAGARAGFVPMTRGRLSRFSEGRLYDVLPGMELTPTNPVTLKPQTMKSSIQMLEELCQKNGWGSPSYTLHSTMTRDGGGDIQLFLFKVSIPGLPSFQPNKLSRSVEEAKVFAAEFCLQQLGFQTQGNEMANLFQGRPISAGPVPSMSQLPAQARDIAFSTTVPVPTSTSYIVATGKMPQAPPPMTPDYQHSPYDFHQSGGYHAGVHTHTGPPHGTVQY